LTLIVIDNPSQPYNVVFSDVGEQGQLSNQLYGNVAL